MPSNKLSPMSGVTLIELLVATAILGLVVLLGGQVLLNMSDGQRFIAGKTNLNQLKYIYLQQLDCQYSMPASGVCPANQPMPIYSRHPLTGGASELIPANGKRLDRWVVRGFCSQEGDGIVLKAAQLIPGRSVSSNNKNDYYPDPLLKRRVRFADAASIISPKKMSLCKRRIKLQEYWYHGEQSASQIIAAGTKGVPSQLLTTVGSDPYNIKSTYSGFNCVKIPFFGYWAVELSATVEPIGDVDLNFETFRIALLTRPKGGGTLYMARGLHPGHKERANVNFTSLWGEDNNVCLSFDNFTNVNWRVSDLEYKLHALKDNRVR